MPRPLAAYADMSLMPGVCGVPAGALLSPFNWTATWNMDCSTLDGAGTPLCYRNDEDVDNDAEPWQELEHIITHLWMLPSSHVRRVRDAERAEVVIVPSALAHCRHPLGWKRHAWWNPAMVDGRVDVHDAYWSALQQRDALRAAARAARNQTREQAMLIHYDGTWQMDYGLAMLGALARQPASFVRRLIIASIEDPLQVEVHARRFAAPHASPTFVSVPFAILVRDVVHAAPLAAVATRAARDARPIALLFTGRPHGSFDGSRQAVYEQLRRMGALCVHGHDGRVSCALCAPPRASDGCRDAFDALRLQRYHDPSAFGALKVLGLASRSVFCIEPTSDTLVRSHTYAAMLAGCVPVLFDTELPFGEVRARHVTEWAWRVGPSHAPILNYSRFAVVDAAMPFVRGERAGLLPSLVRLASDPVERPRLHALQRRLACEAAPLMRYAAPAEARARGGGRRRDWCTAAPAATPESALDAASGARDAFGMLVLTVQAVARGGGRGAGGGGRRSSRWGSAP